MATKADLCLGCMSPLDGGGTCRRCGWSDDDVYDLQYAKPGTVVGGQYLLGQYIRKNGEGALYPGYDGANRKKIWVREYFPSTIAQRSFETGRVTPISGCGAQYKALMSDFIDICSDIKRLGVTEPVVPLENVVAENNTVYAVYEGLALESLESFLSRQPGGLLPLDTALDLLLPICEALEVMHRQGMMHRGISPYTLFMRRDGTLLLWDFALSATRTAGSELDCELYSGYSAPEQYSPSGWQGSWTDVYAMGALFYRVLSGIVPAKPIRVKGQRHLTPLSDMIQGLPDGVSEAIQDAMLHSTEDRTQTMRTFIARLSGPGTAGTAVFDTNKVARAKREKEARERAPRGGSFKFIALGLFATILVLCLVIWYFMREFYPELLGVESDAPVSVSAPPSSDVSVSESFAPPDDDRVPRLYGRTYSDVMADTELTSRYTFKREDDYNDAYAEGVIYDQSPLAGVKNPEDSTIILYVSKGPYSLEMPNLVGLSLDEATAILAAEEFVTFEVWDRYSATAVPGTVLGSYPASGESFDPKRQTVYLYVMPEMPVAESSSRPEEPEYPDFGNYPVDDGNNNWGGNNWENNWGGINWSDNY